MFMAKAGQTRGRGPRETEKRAIIFAQTLYSNAAGAFCQTVKTLYSLAIPLILP